MIGVILIGPSTINRWNHRKSTRKSCSSHSQGPSKWEKSISIGKELTGMRKNKNCLKFSQSGATFLVKISSFSQQTALFQTSLKESSHRKVQFNRVRSSIQELPAQRIGRCGSSQKHYAKRNGMGGSGKERRICGYSRTFGRRKDNISQFIGHNW